MSSACARWTAILLQRIRRRLQAQSDYQFYTGPYKLNEATADRPGSRMIYLAYSERPDSYFDLDKTELWRPTEAANEFALLMDFIRTLPFQATGRMMIMYDDAPREVPAHRDHVETDICHEFVWFRTNLKKPFYMLNHHTGEKKYVESYSAWFDSVNQFHGSDAHDGFRSASAWTANLPMNSGKKFRDRNLTRHRRPRIGRLRHG